MNVEDVSKTVRRIISGMPVEVFDEDQHSVWENDLWELVSPRTQGDFAGSRVIGSANIITAFNIVHQKLLIKQLKEEELNTHNFTRFKQILEHLEQQKLIRKKPHRVRQTFAVVK